MKKIAILLISILLCCQAVFAQHYKPYLSVDEVADSYVLLPDPPKPCSRAFKLDKEYYRKGKKLRNTERGIQAIRDADVSEAGILPLFTEAFGHEISPETMPQLTELLLRAKETFGDYATKAAKEHHMRTRPFVYFHEPSAIPADDESLKLNGSYPSGHTAIFWGLGLILSEINPSRQNEIMERSYEGGFSRIIVGAHWYSDVAAARIVASVAFARLHADPEFCAQLEKAKEEFEQLDK